MTSTRISEVDVQAERIRTVRDVSTLLEFLGQRTDSRLQAHFADTRLDLAAPVRKLAVPPCRTYRHFLSRLLAMGGPLPAPRCLEAPVGGEPEGDEGLDDLAFLYFSRDFLAAVAAPATVDSIRTTHAYVQARRFSVTRKAIRAIRDFSWSGRHRPRQRH